MQSSVKWTLVVLITVAFLIGSAGQALAFFGSSKFEKEVDIEKSAVKLAREAIRGGYRLVTAEELKQWIDSGKEILIVDTMPYEASYKKNHVPGAKQFLFPIPEMSEWDSTQTANKSMDDYQKLLGADKDRVIVVYCGFVKCTRSHNGAVWAVKMGYANVYRFSGGIFAWLGLDFPVEKVE